MTEPRSPTLFDEPFAATVGRAPVRAADPGEECQRIGRLLQMHSNQRVDIDALLDPVRHLFRDEALHLWFLRQRRKGLHEAVGVDELRPSPGADDCIARQAGNYQ